MDARVTGSSVSATCVQGANGRASTQEQGDNRGSHVAIFGIYLILRVLNLGVLKI